MEKKVKEKKVQNKPKHNMFQNSLFMIKLAINSKEKKVLVLCFLASILAVALNLTNLYVSPMILRAVEFHASIPELILTIVFFTVALMLLSATSSYVDCNTLYGRVTVRAEIVNLLNKKAATTSYPNVDDDKFINLLTKASETVSSNKEATEAIWDTLTNITTNILGFIIYVVLLSMIQPILIIVILTTTVISYFISNYANNYRYRHREEEA